VVRPLNQLSLAEVKQLDATELVRASLLDGIQTKGAPPSAPSRGINGHDLALINAISEANGELIGQVRRELDAEIAALKTEITELRAEIAALKGPQLRSVA
jgi:hypothetical protein